MSKIDTNRFNKILAIDSIPHNDYNSAKKLFEDIEMYSNIYTPSPAVEYVRIISWKDLIQCIDQCKKHAEENDVIPMLHIECHGNEDGLRLADYSFASWYELKKPFTDLNISTGLNLMIAVSACTGGALAKSLTLSDRAPFWGLIGPTSPLNFEDCESIYRKFYSTLLSTKSPAKAIENMNKVSKNHPFLMTPSQKLFEQIWKNYIEEYCTPEAMKNRASRMRQQMIDSGKYPLPDIEELKTRLKDQHPEAFKHFREKFFMCDIFPEHWDRFQVDYVE